MLEKREVEKKTICEKYTCARAVTGELEGEVAVMGDVNHVIHLVLREKW